MKLFTITKSTGGVQMDDCNGINVFYVAVTPEALEDHRSDGEVIKEVTATTRKRCWILKHPEQANTLRPAKGVYLATTRRSDAERLAKMCSGSWTPTLIG